MKRIWIRAAAAAALCAVLLSGCSCSSETLLRPVPRPPTRSPGRRCNTPASAPLPWSSTTPRPAPRSGASAAHRWCWRPRPRPTLPTSLCLAYPAVSAMPTVGPVTLGQDLYWRLLSGQQVLPVQRGAGQFARNYLDYYNLRAVDALEVGRNAFTCDADWSSAPLWRTSGKAVLGVLDSLNLSGQLDELAASASSAVTSDSTGADTVLPTLPALLPQEGRAPPAGAGRRGRRRRAGALRHPEHHGLCLRAPKAAPTACCTPTAPPSWTPTPAPRPSSTTCSSCSARSTLRDDGRTLDYDLTLGGGVWLNGGHLWHITWTQGTDSTFLFYDSDGRQLSLCTGRSYLALVSSVTGEELAVQSSAGEELLAHTAA